MARYLMLDVDGVLVTGRPVDGQPWHSELLGDLGIDIDWLRSAFFKVSWPEIVVGRLDLLPALQACLDHAGIDIRASVLIGYWFSMDSRVDQEILAQCGALRRAGVSVYLATNQDHLRAKYLMKDMNLSSHVDGIFYSAQLGVAKPDLGFYRGVTDALCADPAEILLIDDTKNNVRAAHEAGWDAHHWLGTQAIASVIEGNF